ncbi:leucine-rich repeat and guanylate kinase domain-containing protein [Rhynchocyon petersi]
MARRIMKGAIDRIILYLLSVKQGEKARKASGMRATSLRGLCCGRNASKQDGVLRAEPPGARAVPSPERQELITVWVAFDSALRRPKDDASHKTSSYLVRELIHRYRRLEAGQAADQDDEEGEVVVEEEEEEEEEEEGENIEVESEESSESEMSSQEEEFDGILREEVVAEALHKLGRSGCGTGQVYLNLTLSGCDLIDISILCGYVHLEKLDLSVNKIEDVSCVSYMPYLLELNASKNKLTTSFNFKPPNNLKKVDFSYNQISEMSDLSAYQALTKLILDSNEIEEIKGLEGCSNLTHLSLAQNKITTVSGLSALPIKILCLRSNQIEKITGLEDLKALQDLDLSNNQITSLQGLENHDLLEVLNLEDNKIAELREIEHIENLPLLRVLSLLRNPIQEKSDYWLFAIFMLLRLTDLDHKKIKVEEKVSAVNKYDPPPELIAAQDHLTHVMNSMMQPQRIFDSTLPSLDAPYPMLILAGPQACGKRELAHRLCRQFSTYFRYGACHTTRPPYFGEGDRVDYHFISQEVYDEMLSMGKFILTFKYGNHNYGLNRDTVEGIARDGLASCIHMEIEGVRSLKCSYFEPRYILVVPMNKTKYEGYLRRKGLFSRAEVDFAVSRVDLYVKIHQDFPGYFDAVLNADDMEMAYQQLSQLIRGYLGLTEEADKGLALTTGVPSSRKTLSSGVPAHLVPSPRRLAKLQADSQHQITEHLSGTQPPSQVHDGQSHVPVQSQEVTHDGKAHKEALAPHNSTSPEVPLKPGSSGVGTVQQAPDTSPTQKEGSAQLSDDSPKPGTSENESQASGVTPSVAVPSSPNPLPVAGQPDQDEESGEARGAPTSQPPSPGTSPKPQKEDAPKVEIARVSTPYPQVPPLQDAPTGANQTPDKDDPGSVLPRSRLAPTRLPQPRTLAPLQSRRPTPKLLSPSREEARGADSAQTLTPSPRPAPSQGADSKLPPISPAQPSASNNRSPNPVPAPLQAQEEVKLPPISPPSQEQEPQHSPKSPQEEEAEKVKLPQITPPSSDPLVPQDMGAQLDTRPAKDKKAPRVSRAPSKKIGDQLTSPQRQEQMGARKKKLPTPREKTAKGSAHRKQLEAHRKSTPARAPSHQSPGPHQSPQESEGQEVHEPPESPTPPVEEPLPKAAHSQEEPRTEAHHPGAKAQPRRKEDPHKKGRPQRRGPAAEHPGQDSKGSSKPPVTDTQASEGTDHTREGSAQRGNVSDTRQPAREKRTQKNEGPHTQGQGSWQGRLRARGSQSTAV